MSPASVLYLAAMGACGLSALTCAAVAWRRWSRGAERGAAACALAFVLAAWVARIVEVDHLPLFGTYESALSLALATTACGALWSFVRRPVAGVGAWSGILTATLLAHGVTFDPTAYALTISERSWVVDLHAFVAWAAFGVLGINAALAALSVLRGPASDEALARPLAFTLSLGFLLHSAMMATGALYKFLLFGRTWSFDPIETLGFAAWISYGTLVHLNLLGGWQGRKLAPWCLLVFVLLPFLEHLSYFRHGPPHAPHGRRGMTLRRIPCRSFRPSKSR
jgi:ABC-type transport system involved in cytochrome c biogenesis permease subunit